MMVGVGIVIVVLAYAALAIYLTIVYHQNPCERTAPTQLSPEPACSPLSRFDSRDFCLLRTSIRRLWLHACTAPMNLRRRIRPSVR